VSVPSWRDRIAETLVVAPKKEEIKVEAVQPRKELSAEIPQTKKTSAPAFYFDVKDEEEAKEFKDDKIAIEREKKEQSINLGSAKIARKIKDEIIRNDIFSINDISRLSKIIASRLRDIRSVIDIKETFLKKKELGGFGFDNLKSDEICKIIEKEKLIWQKDSNAYINSEIKQPEIKKDFQSDFRENEVRQNNNVNSEKQFANPQLMKIVDAINNRNKKQEVKIQDIKVEEKKPIQETQKEDLSGYDYGSYMLKEKRERRIIGPLEELQAIDLKEFRALGRSPKESVNKIYEKIANLARDGFEQRSKGIISWQNSPLYQLYLSAGEESLIKGLPIEGILKTKNGMTWDEFQAIGDLNEQLNY
jgi:hypothetical protein